jgi:hypothetical protein
MQAQVEVSIAASLLTGLLVTMVAPNAAEAQVLAYKSDAEILGAAHVSPESTRRVLKIIQAACTKGHAGAGDALVKELASWEVRHSRYLGLCNGFRGKLDKLVTDSRAGSEQRKQLVQLQAQIMAALDQGPAEMAKGYVFAIEQAGANQGAEGVDNICGGYAQSVAEGKWELKRNDPQLAAYFDKQK